MTSRSSTASQLRSYHPLIDRYPRLFTHGPPELGFSLPVGWYQLMDAALGEIDRLLTDTQARQFRIDQVKEKFGGLRVYFMPPLPAVRQVVSDAQARSFETCQWCGESGATPVMHGCVITLCERHGLAAQLGRLDVDIKTFVANFARVAGYQLLPDPLVDRFAYLGGADVDIPEGWRRLVEGMLDEMANEAAGQALRVRYIAAGRGRLRVGCGTELPGVVSVIDKAVAASTSTCEVCGSAAQRHLLAQTAVTRCDAHMGATPPTRRLRAPSWFHRSPLSFKPSIWALPPGWKGIYKDALQAFREVPRDNTGLTTAWVQGVWPHEGELAIAFRDLDSDQSSGNEERMLSVVQSARTRSACVCQDCGAPGTATMVSERRMTLCPLDRMRRLRRAPCE